MNLLLWASIASYRTVFCTYCGEYVESKGVWPPKPSAQLCSKTTNWWNFFQAVAWKTTHAIRSLFVIKSLKATQRGLSSRRGENKIIQNTNWFSCDLEDTLLEALLKRNKLQSTRDLLESWIPNKSQVMLEMGILRNVVNGIKIVTKNTSHE